MANPNLFRRGTIRVSKGTRLMGDAFGRKVRIPTNVDIPYQESHTNDNWSVNVPSVGMVFLNEDPKSSKNIEVKIFDRSAWAREKGKEGVRLGGKFHDSFYNGTSENVPFHCDRLWYDKENRK